MKEYKRLTNEELYDFTSRVVVQLEPKLTQQVMSLILELCEYRTKIENGTLVFKESKDDKTMNNYKRLTIRLSNGKIGCLQEYSQKDLINRLADLEDKIERGELVENKVVTYINMARSGNKTLVDKALKYDELKTKFENGTLIMTPCKVGDTVYKIDTILREYYEHEVGGFSVENGELIILDCIDNRYKASELCFSKAEAEAKLKELKGE